MKKETYTQQIVPAFQQFKFNYWGHDGVVLHEHEIRKNTHNFGFLRGSRELRTKFMDDLSTLMQQAQFEICASIINKNALLKKYPNPWNPYEISLYFCLERLFQKMVAYKQKGKVIHVVFESRGHTEDKALEIEFRKICDNDSHWGYQRLDFRKFDFRPVFASKATNSTGLQLADLTARPIALKSLYPEQTNRAFSLIEPKLWVRKVFP